MTRDGDLRNITSLLTDLRLREWTKQGHAWNAAFEGPHHEVGFIARENYARMDIGEFVAKYEEPNLPLVIQNSVSDWKAPAEWTFEVRN